MINNDELLELYDFDSNYDIDPDNDIVIVKGQSFPYEMTLSPEIDDEHCCRVMIDGEYYYFG